MRIPTDEDIYDFHQAIVKKNRWCVKNYLLNHGCNILQRTWEGITPLGRAVSLGHMEIADMLIEAGADIEAGTACRKTPLCCAVRHKQHQMVDSLLDKNANVNAVDANDVSILQHAADCMDINLCESLLSKGADATYKNRDEKTVFDYACDGDFLQRLKALVRRIAPHAFCQPAVVCATLAKGASKTLPRKCCKPKCPDPNK